MIKLRKIDWCKRVEERKQIILYMLLITTTKRKKKIYSTANFSDYLK